MPESRRYQLQNEAANRLIREIVDVGLPRPRDLDMMASDEFGVYTRRIRHLFDAKGWLD